MLLSKKIPSILSPFSSTSESTTEIAERLFRGKLLLAPMVRANTLPFRLLALHYGADTVYTEELVDRKFASGKIKREINEELGTVDFYEEIVPSRKSRASYRAKGLEIPEFHKCTILRVSPEHERGRLIFQVGTNNAARALKAAQCVIQDVAGVDVNMGCPKHFSIHAGMGAGLLKTPEVACDILKTLRKNLPAGKTVSCKIRLLDTENIRKSVDFIQMLEAAGADAIAVHLRTVNERNDDPAHWEFCSQLSQSITVPFIANGDIFDRDDKQGLRDIVTVGAGVQPKDEIEKTKKKVSPISLMMARGALRNCSLFQKHGQIETLENVIRKYLQLSIATRNHHMNTKYVVQQMFKWNDKLGSKIGKQVSGTRDLPSLLSIFGLSTDENTTFIDESVTNHTYSDEYFERKIDESAVREVCNFGGTHIESREGSRTAASVAAKVASRLSRREDKRKRRMQELNGSEAVKRQRKDGDNEKVRCECGVLVDSVKQLKQHTKGRKHRLWAKKNRPKE